MPIRLSIRLSLKGAVYTAAALLLLSMGILRKELIAEICGAVLSAYSLFAFVASGITTLLWRNTVPEITMKKNIFFVSPQAKRFPFCTAGTTAHLIVALSREYPAHEKELVPVRIPLEKASTRFTAELPQRKRYFYVRRSIIISDFAGFFSFTILQPDFDLSIRRTPFFMLAAATPVSGLSIPDITSAAQTFEPNTQRNTELYESRSYFPGDDPRKIHWKLYAHTRSLAIRLGEYEPPPVKTVSIYIENPRAVNRKEAELLEPFFDSFIGKIQFFVMQLLEQGFSCTVLLHNKIIPSCDTDTAAAPAEKKTAEDNSDFTSLYTYPVSGIDAHAKIPELFTIPQISRGKKNTNNTIDAVYQTVPNGGVLFYFYLPLLKETDAVQKQTAAEKALHTDRVQTFFYPTLAAVTQNTNNSNHGGKSGNDSTNISARKKHELRSRLRKKLPALEPLLYCSRQERLTARYASHIAHAAERDITLLTQGQCNAEIL